PMFGKLKTLLLNEWFTAIDLVCIFRHSPVLEMLTLHLGNTKVYHVYIKMVLFH
uniref:FBD domain-containing protein n=1 Tax=Aegilops tauschii subsp. strangulata TaxID=200361 RepID=A0A453MWG6_AEGTS